MAIAGRCGINIMLDSVCKSTNTAEILSTLFNEELGAVFQVRKSDEINFHRCFATCGPPGMRYLVDIRNTADRLTDGLIKKIGQVSPSRASSPYDLIIYHRMDLVYRSPISKVCTRLRRCSFLSTQISQILGEYTEESG